MTTILFWTKLTKRKKGKKEPGARSQEPGARKIRGALFPFVLSPSVLFTFDPVDGIQDRQDRAFDTVGANADTAIGATFVLDFQVDFPIASRPSVALRTRKSLQTNFNAW